MIYLLVNTNTMWPEHLGHTLQLRVSFRSFVANVVDKARSYNDKVTVDNDNHNV